MKNGRFCVRAAAEGDVPPRPLRGRSLRGRLLPLLPVLLLAFLPMTARAGEPSDYPSGLFLMNSPDPPDAGQVSLSFLPTYENRPNSEELGLPVSLDLDLSDELAFSVDFDAYKRIMKKGEDDVSGAGDLTLSLSYTFPLPQDSPWIAAFSLDALFPTGDVDRGLSDGFFQLTPSFQAGYRLPWLNARLDAQLGYTYVTRAVRKTPGVSGDDDADGDGDDNGEEKPADILIAGLGLEIPFGPFVFTQELYYTSSRWNHRGKDEQAWYCPGFFWIIDDAFQVGVGVPLSLTKDARNHQVMGYFSWSFDLPDAHR